jgi:hypothetical protein
MIQRIQTLYLLLAAALTGLLVRLPFCVSHSTNTNYFANVVGYYSAGNPAVPVYSTTYLLILTSVIVVTILAAIFMFSSRKNQIRLSIGAILLNGVLASLLINFPGKLHKELPEIANNIEFSFGISLPILSALCLILAIRSIRKDEKLVKSADRLR